MKEAVLYFPDTNAMANFILHENISHSEVNSRDISVKGLFTDEEIETAERKYEGWLPEKNLPS